MAIIPLALNPEQMKVYVTQSGIKGWAEDDRPREKLLNKGSQALSDSELLAILLGSGAREDTAVDLAKRILNHVKNNLNELGRLDVSELTNFKGVGEAKAVKIIAALELGKRRRLSEALHRKKINGSSVVFEIMQPILGDLPHEEFWAIFLSTSNKVLAKKCFSKGGITGTLADIRMIFRDAVIMGSTGLIICHNHPSGNCSPSYQDKSLTKKISDAGQLMDIKLLDHLIITEHQYFSFADEGIM